MALIANTLQQTIKSELCQHPASKGKTKTLMNYSRPINANFVIVSNLSYDLNRYILFQLPLASTSPIAVVFTVKIATMTQVSKNKIEK